MQFNFFTSNPAFNIAEGNNIAGTGGNTTLYRTATRQAFDDLLLPKGILLNITLKGIIPDLVDKHFSKWHIHEINLMDNIDVWNYNTCYFFIEKIERFSKVKITGGLASKIYSPYKDDCFPFVYYSGADKGMTHFDSSFSNKVIRKLPGKNNDSFLYDYTNIDVPAGPKFAFNVMESKKSYSVTEEPIRGGTICYIPTKTIEQAEKLKLFVENNDLLKMYVERTKQKYHAFAMRNVKRFDIDQIITGKEIPVEWNITEEDINHPIELENEIIENREKVKKQGEVFTPTSLVNRTLDDLKKYKTDAFSNPQFTFCDNMAGNGKFLVNILNRKISAGIDKKTALKSIFGVELDRESVEECRFNLSQNDPTLKSIVEKNIVCADALNYNYNFN